MKLRVGVIFGGVSVEHEVSIISAVQAMKQIDEENYFNRRSSYRTLTCRTLCWLSERESETSELRQVR